MRSALVVAEVALALVLAAGAGLLIKAFGKILEVNPGFNPRGVLTASTSLPTAKYRERPQRIGFYRQVLANLQSAPGVQAAGMVSLLPLGGTNSGTIIHVENRPEVRADEAPVMWFRSADAGYFRAMEIPLRRGRLFTEQDTETAPAGRDHQRDDGAPLHGWSPRSRGSYPRTGRRRPRGGEVEILDSRRWAGRGRWTGLGTARDRRGDPPGRRRSAAGRGGGRAGGVRPGRAARAGAGQQAGRDRLGRQAGRDRGLAGFTDDQAYRAMDFLLDALGEIAARDLRLGRAPAEPGPGHRVRRHDLHLLRARRPRRARRTADRVADDGAQPPGRARARARSGTPRTTAPTCRRW